MRLILYSDFGLLIFADSSTTDLLDEANNISDAEDIDGAELDRIIADGGDIF